MNGKPSFLKVAGRLVRYASGRDRILLLGAILLLSANLLLDIGIAAIQEQFIDTINQSNLATLMRLTGICSAAALVVLLSFMAQYYLKRLSIRRMTRGVAEDLFAKTGRLPFRTAEEMHSGDLVSRNSKDTELSMKLVESAIFDLGYNLVLCLVAFGYLVRLNVVLAFVALGAGPLVFLSGRFFDRRLRGLSESILAKEASVRAILQEILQGVQVVRVFGMEEVLVARYAEERKQLNAMLQRRAILNGLLWQVSSFINGVVLIGCGGLMAYYTIQGEATAGGMVAFILLMGRVQWPFVNMSRTWGAVQESLGAADRVFAVLDLPSEPGTESSRPAAPTEAADAPVLALKDVHLQHPGQSSEPLFSGLSLAVQPGETVAVVGPSGSGKTTLARLACGLYEPDQGDVEVAGVPLLTHREEARSHLTYVPQSPYLFSGTIQDNIAFGSEGASRDAIEQAAKLAGAHEFIERLPDGYDTVLTESGANLSGGQRQRLAIARAFLRQAPLLILDEATSALDNESEGRVQEALDTLMQGRSTLVIAHRLSTVRGATRIVVLDRGKIVETGTHAELLARGGLYAHLYELQFAQAEKGELAGAAS
ncbi:ABC transporter ATP-binding protein [Gorillibacterium sp. CAU 1737]|uniref:ABC transporter ATP-binding protein n=1 Tax=Gorillibacterium sp. CAU 1737 TaxID=3140362 RepID=UPI003261B0C4